MMEIAENYAREAIKLNNGDVGHKYNEMWGFDVIHGYFKVA